MFVRSKFEIKVNFCARLDNMVKICARMSYFRAFGVRGVAVVRCERSCRNERCSALHYQRTFVLNGGVRAERAEI